MTSTFNSFDASALGARIQSAIDGQGAFGSGGQTFTGTVTVGAFGNTTIDHGQTIYCSGEDLFTRYVTNSPATPPDTIWVQEYHGFVFSTGDPFTPIFTAGALQVLEACATTGQIVLTGQTSGTTITINGHAVTTDGDIADGGDTFAGATFGGLTSINAQPWVWGMTPNPDNATGGDVWRIAVSYPRAPSAEAESRFIDWTNGETVDAVLTV